ncbi:competence protein ComEA [Candidatus Electrothrix marina]|uniref:Competence protein ComEA n=1 Tax=Candidatus Electrothrix marina TaxID=1859130 RepID=A0A444JHF5_9BACT|nr:competence protein ComEA [Candidatus Electrothrix marina]
MKSFYFTLFFVFFLTTSAAAVVNINTASLEELTSLPGIGQVKAESILKYREEKGLFNKVDELKNVYGIGAKIVARLKDEITVGEAAPAVAATAVEKQTAQKVPEEQTLSMPPAKK